MIKDSKMPKIDISDLMQEMVERLELDYHFVRTLTIRPDCIEAEVYSKNDQGQKFITPDGVVALDTIHFRVTT